MRSNFRRGARGSLVAEMYVNPTWSHELSLANFFTPRGTSGEGRKGFRRIRIFFSRRNLAIKFAKNHLLQYIFRDFNDIDIFFLCQSKTRYRSI